MSVACVTFEIATTLARLASPRSRLYSSPLRDALRYYNLPCPAESELKAAFRVAHKRVTADEPNFGARNRLLGEREWWQKLVYRTLEAAGCDGAMKPMTFELIFQRAYSTFGVHGVWEAAPGAALALAHAKKSGLIVGAIDNLYRRYVDNNLPALGLHEHLDFAVLSQEEDVAKPDVAIYECAALRAAHVAHLLQDKVPGEQGTVPLELHRMLHVGSSLEGDYLAARRCGMRALLIDPEGRHAHAELMADDVLSSLVDLPQKLDELCLPMRRAH